ncbi:MAG: hypothetical protein V7776_04935 [Halopseudomonas aestusnigri]
MVAINEGITNGADDAYDYISWSGNKSSLRDTRDRMSIYRQTNFSSSASEGGIRFQSVDIPNTATINSATLNLYVWSTSGGKTVDVFGNDVDSQAAWSVGGIRGATVTTAYTTLTDPAISTVHNVDVQGIISEITTRPGWSTGNDIGFVLRARLQSRLRVATSEHATSPEPSLDIDFTLSEGPTPTRSIKMGSSEVSAIKLGAVPITKAYLGSNIIFDG